MYCCTEAVKITMARFSTSCGEMRNFVAGEIPGGEILMRKYSTLIAHIVFWILKSTFQPLYPFLTFCKEKSM